MAEFCSESGPHYVCNHSLTSEFDRDGDLGLLAVRGISSGASLSHRLID